MWKEGRVLGYFGSWKERERAGVVTLEVDYLTVCKAAAMDDT